MPNQTERQGDIQFDVNPSHVNLAAISDLLESVGMRKRKSEELQRAIGASSDVVVAVFGNEVVGFGRMISDETYYGSIWDVAVRPEMQRRGIGTRIMQILLERGRERNLYMFGLFTGGQNRDFYERLGFAFHEHVYAMTANPAKSDQRSEVSND